jgi:asparagine synthase (glutamine-hydrolysing)
VSAHYVVELQLIGCPDPDPVYTRSFDPQRNKPSADLDEIGRAGISALADEIAKWLQRIDGTGASRLPLVRERAEARADQPTRPPFGVCFSGGIDSGAVFPTTCHVMRQFGGGRKGVPATAARA